MDIRVRTSGLVEVFFLRVTKIVLVGGLLTGLLSCFCKATLLLNLFSQSSLDSPSVSSASQAIRFYLISQPRLYYPEDSLGQVSLKENMRLLSLSGVNYLVRLTTITLAGFD
jgi:hypothetical protein